MVPTHGRDARRGQQLWQNPDSPQTCLKKHEGHDKGEKTSMLYAGQNL